MRNRVRDYLPHLSIGLSLAVLLFPCALAAEAGSAAGRGLLKRGLLRQAPASQDAAIRGIVDRYWAGNAEQRYSLLSEKFRDQLRVNLGITNAAEYERRAFDPERFWGKPMFQRIDAGPDSAQVVTLMGWKQEGYEGVMTFIFELVKVKGAWKIEYVMS